MRLRWKITLGVVGVLAVLLALNAYSTGRETKEAAPTTEGAQILELTAGDVQVVDSGEAQGGSGQPVVLLHCYACSLHWFERLVPLLAEEHRVIAIDLLGFGGSEAPESGYEIENQAKLVAEVMNELEVEGAMVVGNSMGGMVAASLAEQASQLVDRAVVIGSGPDTENYGDLPLLARLEYVPVLGQAMWRLSPDFAVKDSYGDAFSPGYDPEDGFDDPDQLLHDFDAMTYTSFKEAHDAADEFTAEAPLDERFRQAAVPLMAILGSEDRIVDPEKAAEAYSGVPGARVETIEDAGHTPQIETPEEVAELLESFAVDVVSREVRDRPADVSRNGPRPSPSQRGDRPRRTRPQSGAPRDGGQAGRGPRQGANRNANN